MVKEFFVILAALFLGYGLSFGLNLPVPSNVLGFILLFAALCLKIVKLRDVEKLSDFIIKYLSLFFVVPTVGIMVHFDLIGEQLFKILVPLMISILLGYFVTAKVTELIINYEEKKKMDKGRKMLGGSQNE